MQIYRFAAQETFIINLENSCALNILVSNIFMNKNVKETAFEISCETHVFTAC